MSMGRLILWGPQPQAHVTALLQLSPDCGTAVPGTVITPSSQALAGLWSSRGPPHSSGRSPRAISVLGSQFPWGMCPHPPLPFRSLHHDDAHARLKSLCPVSGVPCPAKRQGLVGPQTQQEALSCNEANTASGASARGMPLPLLPRLRVPGFGAERKISA